VSEFVGRTGSMRVYSYPETRRSGSDPLTAFARNFATGTKGSNTVGPDGLDIVWNAIDVGVDPDNDVPITPKATGQLLITGVITLTNGTGAPIDAVVTVHLDGVAAGPSFATMTIPAGATAAIPFMAETEVISPLNEEHLIQVFVDGDGLTTVSDGSVINVQEVVLSTG